MNERASIPALEPRRFVAPAAAASVDTLLRIPLHLSDRPLVSPGSRVEPGQPIAERFREQDVVELATDAALLSLRPGQPVDHALLPRGGRRGQGHLRPGARARVIGHTRDGRTLLAVGRGDIAVFSPVSGRVETVLPGRIDLRAEGTGFPGLVAWGRPVSGRLLMAASSPDTELRASAIDVAAAGTILVVGARLDIEALTRARAIGVAGIVCGSIVGRELRQLGESEMRQRAALHPAAPFALISLGGYGRRPIPSHAWEMLLAAEGRGAGIVAESRLLVVDGDPGDLVAAVRRPADAVVVSAGDHAGMEGRLLGLAGARRWPGGTYAPGGFVELVGLTGTPERLCLPLSDLERLG